MKNTFTVFTVYYHVLSLISCTKENYKHVSFNRQDEIIPYHEFIKMQQGKSIWPVNRSVETVANNRSGKFKLSKVITDDLFPEDLPVFIRALVLITILSGMGFAIICLILLWYGMAPKI